MKAVLDHVGIAVADLDAALRFYSEALGLEISAPEDVPSQRLRARFVPVGPSSLELLQATAPDSPIARFVEKRGPGLHHITLRVEDIHAALAQLKARGARLIDDQPRPGAEGALVAFIHPSSAHGVLVELKQSAVGGQQSAVGSQQSAVDGQQSAVGSQQSAVDGQQSAVDGQQSAVDGQRSAVGGRPAAPSTTHVVPSATHVALSTTHVAPSMTHAAPRTAHLAPGTPHLAPNVSHLAPVQRFALGNLELISVSDGFFRLDGGSMFGVVPKTLWSRVTSADERNRITLGLRPLVVRGARTMIIDAGIGDKENGKFHEIYGVDRTRHLDHSLADAGLSPEDIDIVLASHLHFDHAGGFTARDASGRLRPRFPRAQYIARRGEWEDATHPNVRTRASYLPDNYVPLAEAGVLQLVDDDQTIMPGVRVVRTGGHTPHHQMVVIESGGKTAAFVADLMPTTAHVPDTWIMGYDLSPMDTLVAKQRFAKDAVANNTLVFFEHDPVTAAGYLRDENGKRFVVGGG